MNWFDRLFGLPFTEEVPLVEEIAHLPAKEETTGASPVGHTDEKEEEVTTPLTASQKLDILSQDTAINIESSDFTEWRTIDARGPLKMVSSGVWRADVTYYFHRQGGVFRQDATFTDARFEGLVEKIWEAHQEEHARIGAQVGS